MNLQRKFHSFWKIYHMKSCVERQLNPPTNPVAHYSKMRKLERDQRDQSMGPNTNTDK